MSNWVMLDIDRLNEPRRVNIHDQMRWSMPSPYDLPKAIRSRMSADRAHVRVELDYLDDEEETMVQTDAEWLKLYVGRHSGRLMTLELESEHFKPTVESRLVVLEHLAKAWSQIKEKHSRPEVARQRSFDIAHAVVADYFEHLSKNVEATAP